MAHALYGHDGPCKNIHGHSYSLSVTLKGKPLKKERDAKTGMVIDFADLKKLVKEEIIEKFDHSLVLSKTAAGKFKIRGEGQNLIVVDFQPTCENLVIHFAKILKKAIPKNLHLHHLLLKETTTSFAEWYAEDNS